MHTAKLRILRLPDVLNKVGLKRSTLYDLIGEGDFPKQVQLGERTVGWLESEVEGWIEKRIKASRPVKKSKNLGGGHAA